MKNTILAIFCLFYLAQSCLADELMAGEAYKMTVKAENILRKYDKQQKIGSITLEQAKSKAIIEINSIRYGQYGCIGIMDDQGVIISYIIDAMTGKKMTIIRDKNRNKKTKVYFFKNLLDVVNDLGYGFVEYHWHKPRIHDDQIFKTVMFGRKFDEWGWIVFTWVYVE